MGNVIHFWRSGKTGFDFWRKRRKNTKGFHLILKDELPVITKSQLALRNGQDKPEIWVAFNSMVYDVTASRLWLRGKHYEHWAGQDLSDELKDAPHTEKVFDRFNIVGRLAK